MAMGIVSDADFQKELGNSAPKIPVSKTAEVIKQTPKGRGEGNVAVPDSMRKLIGAESVENGRDSAIELAKQFGISPSSVSAYANGSTSTASYDKQPNLPAINGVKERIAKKARNRLSMALSHITDEKLGAAKLTEVSTVARDMAAIVKQMEPEVPKTESDKQNGPTFIFYSPQFRKEEHFDVIDVKE